MTNLNIAKLYLATTPTVTTAAQLETAVTSGAAATAVNALTGTALLNAIYNALFGRDADADGLAYWGASTLTGDALITAINGGAATYPADGAFAALNTADKATLANKAAVTTTGVSEAQAVFILDTVTDSAATVTAANTTVAATVETANIAAYNTALTAHTAAVTTATASKAAADAAGLTVNSVALATAYQTAANTAKTDADAVVTAATALSAAAAKTPSLVDDASSAIAVTGATTAQTAAAALVTDAAADLAAATAAAAAAASVGSSYTLTTGTDVTFFGTTKSDTWTANQTTFNNNDVIVDSSTIDSDVLNVTATDDITATPTVVGIENVNFNLNAVTTAGVATDFAINAANISASKINVAVTKAGSTVTTTSLTNVKTGVTVETNLTTASVATVADADVTVNMIGSTGTFTQTGTADTLAITSTGNFTANGGVNPFTVEESITINSNGTVTISDDTANAAASAVAVTISAKGAVLIDEWNDKGSLNVTTTTGNIAIGEDATGVDAVNSEYNGNVTLSTAAGDVVVADTLAMGAGDTLTVTATGDGNADASAPAADGDVSVAKTGAETVVVTATGGIAIGDAEGAKTLTLSAGQASTIANTVSNVQTLNLSSVSTSTTPITFTATAGDGADNQVADGLTELDTIVFSGSKSVTLVIDTQDLITAAASTANSTTASAVIATDNSTATSRIKLVATTVDAAVDVSKLAVDEIELNGALSAADAFTVANGAKLVIGGTLTTADLNITAAAVAGNSVTIVMEDNNNGVANNTVNDITAGLTVSNIATVNLQANDVDASADIQIGAVALGAAGTMVITGSTDIDFTGAFTGLALNGSAATGDITIANVNATTTYTTGAGADSFTSLAAQNLSITAGAGTDTLVLTNNTYAANTLTLSGIEVINSAGGAVTLAGSHVTNSSYVFGGTNAFTITAQTGTGEIVNLSNTASSVAVTLNGSAGGDTLTGSSTTATTINGLAGADTINGGAAADTIDGGNDADAINVTETVQVSDTIVYSLVETGLADKITGFKAGATNGDIISMAAFQFEVGSDGTTNVNTVDATDELVATTDVVVAATTAALTSATAGVYVFSTDIGGTINFSTATDAEIAAAIEAALEHTTANVLSGTATAAVTNGAASAALLLGFTDGSNTTLVKYVESGADADFNGELTVVATLVGVDASTLTHDNFLA